MKTNLVTSQKKSSLRSLGVTVNLVLTYLGFSAIRIIDRAFVSILVFYVVGSLVEIFYVERCLECALQSTCDPTVLREFEISRALPTGFFVSNFASTLLRLSMLLLMFWIPIRNVWKEKLIVLVATSLSSQQQSQVNLDAMFRYSTVFFPWVILSLLCFLLIKCDSVQSLRVFALMLDMYVTYLTLYVVGMFLRRYYSKLPSTMNYPYKPFYRAIVSMIAYFYILPTVFPCEMVDFLSRWVYTYAGLMTAFSIVTYYKEVRLGWTDQLIQKFMVEALLLPIMYCFKYILPKDEMFRLPIVYGFVNNTFFIGTERNDRNWNTYGHLFICFFYSACYIGIFLFATIIPRFRVPLDSSKKSVSAIDASAAEKSRKDGKSNLEQYVSKIMSHFGFMEKPIIAIVWAFYFMFSHSVQIALLCVDLFVIIQGMFSNVEFIFYKKQLDKASTKRSSTEKAQ